MSDNDTAEHLTAEEEAALNGAVYTAEKAVDDMKRAFSGASFMWVTREEAAETAVELQDAAEAALDALNSLISAVAELASEAS